MKEKQMTEVQRVVSNIKTLGNEKFLKADILDVMLSLEKEIINYTFAGQCEAKKLMDCEDYFLQKNRVLGNPAKDEIRKFMVDSKKLHNLIKAEISGRRGEEKAFSSFENIKQSHLVHKNVELAEGDTKTELDAVVITSKCITIVEVKNTSRDVYINENGNYYRTGEFLKWDCNIAEKMKLREAMLKRILSKSGYEWVEIKSVVVFTDSRIEVQNKYKGLKTCFVSQLPYIIAKNGFNICLSDKDMASIRDAIELSRVSAEYYLDFDIEQYKRNFAELVVKINAAEQRKENSFVSRVASLFCSKIKHTVGVAAAL